MCKGQDFRWFLSGFCCRTCGFKFHQKCALRVPKLCQQVSVNEISFWDKIAANHRHDRWECRRSWQRRCWPARRGWRRAWWGSLCLAVAGSIRLVPKDWIESLWIERQKPSWLPIHCFGPKKRRTKDELKCTVPMQLAKGYHLDSDLTFEGLWRSG